MTPINALTPDDGYEPVYRRYRRTQVAEMADWVPEFDMSNVSVSSEDAKHGSPKQGDKIARNPANHDDRWLVAADYFVANFGPIEPNPLDQVEAEVERLRTLLRNAADIIRAAREQMPHPSQSTASQLFIHMAIEERLEYIDAALAAPPTTEVPHDPA